MLNLGDKLYEMLPEIYKQSDSEATPIPYPLQRFFKVLGGGFDFLEEKITEYSNILDVDNCPKEYLLSLAGLLGFEFPYSMDEATQRKFIRILPTLYRLKGTSTSFEYLAHEIFGKSAVISSYNATYTEGMLPEEWRKIFVKVELDGESLYLAGKEENFRKFVEILRPVNSIIITDLSLFYLDSYNTKSKVSASYPDEYNIYEFTEELVSKDPTEVFPTEILTVLAETDIASLIKSDDDVEGLNIFKFIYTDGDTFSKVNFNDDTLTVKMTESITSEDYLTSIADTGTTNIVRAKPASLFVGTNKLVTSFRTTDFIPLNSSISH